MVEPKAAKTVAGEPVGMETFYIACAKAMGMPGFGPAAIKDKDGAAHPLERAEDWYLRAGANIAFAGRPVADAPDEELAMVGLDRLRGVMEATLKPEEWRKVAYVLARGGRYQDAPEAFQGERFAGRPMRMLHLYNEQATARSHHRAPVQRRAADAAGLRRRHADAGALLPPTGPCCWSARNPC